MQKDDVIYRQAAIDTIKRLSLGETDAVRLAFRTEDYLKRLPSAEPKKGKWIAHPNKEFKEWDVCTACGVGCKRREYEDGGVTEYNYPFCPNCGADMRGEENV